MQETQPISWFWNALGRLQWPGVTISAFALGRYMHKLEARAAKAEKNLSDLMTRHLPHIHTALSEISIKLESIQTAVFGRNR